MAPELDCNGSSDLSFARIHSAATDSPGMRKSRGAEVRSDSMSPQGLKHRISILEKIVNGHGEELTYHKAEFNSLRKTKDKADEISESLIRTIEKNLVAEIERIRDDFGKALVENKGEIGRMGTQLRSLKAEKTMLQNQVAALQRRILTLDEEIEMAKLVNMLERYRSCSQELRQLYLDSQDSLENKTRAIEGLKLELQAARRESETLSARCHAIMEKTTTEIAALKAQLETSRATITAFGDTEKFLLETKARVVEEKSASLALRSQIKRMESEIQQVNAECEKKLKAVESSYKVKLEVLLSTVSELEEFKEDASRMGKENIKLKQTNAVLGLRVKDLESELDSVTSERNKDQSELMKDNTRLGKQVLEYETQKWLLEEQILAHKRQIDSLEQRVGSYVQTNTELRDLVNRLSEQRKTESSETDISEELARVRGEVKILTLDLENERSKISRMQTKITRLEQRKAALKQERAKMVELFKNKLRHAS